MIRRILAVCILVLTCFAAASQSGEDIGIPIDPNTVAPPNPKVVPPPPLPPLEVPAAVDLEVDPELDQQTEAEKSPTMYQRRPGEAQGPTEIEFYVYIIDIDDIDAAAQNFAVNVFISLEWKDEALAMDRENIWQVPLQQIWNPRIMITNKQGIVRKSFPEVAEVQPDGTVIYRQRYVGRMSQPLRLSQFPFDQHTFTITFVAVGYTPEELKFVPGLPRTAEGPSGGGMYDQLSVPDWRITEYKAEARPFVPLKGIEVAGFAFDFVAKRYAVYYVWQVIIPLILIVMMSWGGFWIDPASAGARIGVATSSMLTLIAYRFMLGGLTPKLSYMTRLDYFTLGSTILVFLTLVEVILTSLIMKQGDDAAVRRMDMLARFFFPAAFAGWAALTLLL